MDDYIIKRFENPDEVREFDKGKYEVVNLPHMTIGKATYHKGWKWSDDVSPLSGTEFCETEHLGMVISCLLYTSPSPRDRTRSRMPSSA